jgi:hypothetical protein
MRSPRVKPVIARGNRRQVFQSRAPEVWGLARACEASVLGGSGSSRPPQTRTPARAQGLCTNRTSNSARLAPPRKAAILMGDWRDSVRSRQREKTGAVTGHYSVAQIDELVAALDLIADEHGRANKTLQMLQLEAKKQVVA